MAPWSPSLTTAAIHPTNTRSEWRVLMPGAIRLVSSSVFKTVLAFFSTIHVLTICSSALLTSAPTSGWETTGPTGF